MSDSTYTDAQRLHDTLLALSEILRSCERLDSHLVGERNVSLIRSIAADSLSYIPFHSSCIAE